MPDYFDRLLAKASDVPGPTPRVRPRLPHLFERPTSVVELEQHGEVDAPPSSPSPPEGPVPTTPPLAHRATPAPRPAPLAERPVEVRTEIRQDVTRSVEVVEAVHRLAERIEVRHGPQLVPVPIPPPPPVQPAPPPTVPPVELSYVDQRQWVLPQDRAAPGEQRWQQQPPHRPPRAAERAIQVTIGRLEVNAAGTGKPEPPPRPARATPVVSLERYLAGNDGRP
jgi:hypothetical protein